MERRQLKQDCLALLAACAREHPSGHQGKLAARYLLHCGRGDAAELMFEKGPKTPANLWVASGRIAGLKATDIDIRLSPASSLYAVVGADGKPQYGRHSALKSMNELRHADLACIRIEAITDLKRILEHISG